MKNNCSTCTQVPIVHYTNLYIERVTLPSIGAIGFIGNIVAIVIICKRYRKSTFHQSLLNLAVIDILFVSIVISDVFCFQKCDFYMYLLPYFWNPVKNILMSWETFLLMSIALERFLAVCHPLLYRAHKARHSQVIHMITYIVPSFIFSIAINIPKFFETKLIIKNVTNATHYIGQEIDVGITDLRKSFLVDLNFNFKAFE